MSGMKRREFLKTGIAAGMLAGINGCAGNGRSGGHVVVVGGGYGGATVAKYLRLWSAGTVQVTLVERQANFVSCPLSNLVIGGSKHMDDITLSYRQLQDKWGVRVIQDEVITVNSEKRSISLQTGGTIRYDRLVLSPGIDFIWDDIPALRSPSAREQILHAWKAGPQTQALRRQLEQMPDGGVYALSIPRAPYRCPPGPYERACLVADYFRKHKPRSKVVILDANEDIQSKKGLFKQAWNDLYGKIIEYRPLSEVRDVDVASKTAILEFDRFKADVLNIVPPQRAGRIAAESGLGLINRRWVEVNDWLTLESTTPGIHVLGDALFPAPAMPKSGHMANQHGKLAAAAIIRLLAGEAPNPEPVLMNTCYSFVDAGSAIHVASVHQYDAASRNVQPVKGAGGVSTARSEHEARVALGWASNIWADMLT
ncbi:MAG: NAD(P)/FAD-dependent oxidoreductase [Azonexus sp.]|nr:NAD(P)/FAD-dependent oxidoreductase [Azonexus sp.]MCK6411845.1 NAD(P)/FAD-dependent oxidoreductase [Azonexus sp.]